MTDAGDNNVKDDSAEDILYQDLPNFQYEEELTKYKNLSKKYEEEASFLCARVKELTEENIQLLKKCDVLKYNASVLYNTAISETTRKNNTINDLRRELDSIKFRRNKKITRDQCINTEVIKEDIKKVTKDRGTNTEIPEVMSNGNGVKKAFEERCWGHINGRNSRSSASSGSKLSEYDDEKIYYHSKERVREYIDDRREDCHRMKSRSREEDERRREKDDRERERISDRGRENEAFRRKISKEGNNHIRSRYDKHYENHKDRERECDKHDSKHRSRNEPFHRYESNYKRRSHSKEWRTRSKPSKPQKRSSSRDRRRKSSDRRRSRECYEPEIDKNRDHEKDKKKENIFKSQSFSTEKSDSKQFREEKPTIKSEKIKTEEIVDKKDSLLDIKKVNEKKDRKSDKVSAMESMCSVDVRKEIRKEPDSNIDDKTNLKPRKKVDLSEYKKRKSCLTSSENNNKKYSLHTQSPLDALYSEMKSESSRTRNGGIVSFGESDDDDDGDGALSFKNERPKVTIPKTLYSKRWEEKLFGSAASAQNKANKVPSNVNNSKEEIIARNSLKNNLKEEEKKNNLKEKKSINDRLENLFGNAVDTPEKVRVEKVPELSNIVVKSNEEKEPGEITDDECEKSRLVDNLKEKVLKTGSPKKENTKIESPKEENIKIERPKEENMKIESPKEENAKIKSPKGEFVKQKNQKEEITKEENTRNEGEKEESRNKENKINDISNTLNKSSDLKANQSTDTTATDTSTEMDTMIEPPKTPDIRESQNSSLFNDVIVNLNRSDEHIVGNILQTSSEPVSEIAGDQTFQEIAEKLLDGQNEFHPHELQEYSPFKSNYKLIEIALTPRKKNEMHPALIAFMEKEDVNTGFTAAQHLDTPKKSDFCSEENSIQLNQNSSDNNFLIEALDSSLDLTIQTSKELDSDEKKTEENSLETSVTLETDKNDAVVESAESNDIKPKSSRKRTRSHTKKPSSRRKSRKGSEKNLENEKNHVDPDSKKNDEISGEGDGLSLIKSSNLCTQKLDSQKRSSQKKDNSRKRKSPNEIPEASTRVLRERKSKSKEPPEENINVKKETRTRKSTPSRNTKRKRDSSMEKPDVKQKESNKKRKVDDKNDETAFKINKNDETVPKITQNLVKTDNVNIFSPLPSNNSNPMELMTPRRMLKNDLMLTDSEDEFPGIEEVGLIVEIGESVETIETVECVVNTEIAVDQENIVNVEHDETSSESEDFSDSDADNFMDLL